MNRRNDCVNQERSKTMIEPCRDFCYLRYGRQYTTKCDTMCKYAEVGLSQKINADIIEYLLDMLEEEHDGMRTVARNAVKERFGVEI